MQLDRGERGFSFSKEGPLDMRMNQSQHLKAEEIVNTWSEKALGEVFREYGEERGWKRVAKAIVERRKKMGITTTTQLSRIVEESLGRPPGLKRHIATKVFQALRMAVNTELESIKEGVSSALKHLAPEGRLAAITFHSLEDRLVKSMLKEASLPIKRIIGEREETTPPSVDLLTKKPIVPTPGEVKRNPRSRSAKLRAVKRHG